MGIKFNQHDAGRSEVTTEGHEGDCVVVATANLMGWDYSKADEYWNAIYQHVYRIAKRLGGLKRKRPYKYKTWGVHEEAIDLGMIMLGWHPYSPQERHSTVEGMRAYCDWSCRDNLILLTHDGINHAAAIVDGVYVDTKNYSRNKDGSPSKIFRFYQRSRRYK